MLLYPRDQNSIIEEAQDNLSYMLKTKVTKQFTLKKVSEFSPKGIIGLGLL